MYPRRIIFFLLCWTVLAVSCFATPPPVITVQPTNTTVLKRDTASFNVVATSGTTLSYQWYFGSTAINGATNDTVYISNCTSNNAGQYYVAVRNAGGTVNSSKATLTVNYFPPAANNDAYATTENTALSVAAPGVLGNDTDFNGDSMVAQLVSGVSHGTLTLSTTGAFTYIPVANYSGNDSFTYQAKDSDGLVSSSAIVTLSVTWVDQPPVPANQSVSLLVNTVTSLTLSATDVDGQSLTYSIVSAPTNGVLSGLNANTGQVTYTPGHNFTGNDYLTFAAFDGTLTATGQVRLKIMAPPSVALQPASSVTLSSAVLNAGVNAQGAPTSCYFRYGLSTNYDSSTALVSGLSSSTNAVTNSLSGLQDGTEYHYCLVASNAAGVTLSQDATFTTSVGAPAGSSLSATSVAINSATLNAQVTQQLVSLSCYFQYGTTTNYGLTSSSVAVPILGGLLGGSGLFGVTIPVSGLEPDRIYHYRLVTTGLATPSYSPDASFLTVSLPPIVLSGRVNSNGKMVLVFTNTPGVSFIALGSTNLVDWTQMGTTTEVSSGHYQFIDPMPATNRACWYRVRSP